MRTPASFALIFPLAVCATLVAPQTTAAQEQSAASTAVAPAAPAAAVATTPAPAKRKRNSNLITAEEIREISAANAYEAVSRLRSHWLRKRGVSSINREGSSLVYHDGMRAGTPEALRRINADVIESISFLNGSQATQRYGLDHGNGAIVISSRR